MLKLKSEKSEWAAKLIMGCLPLMAILWGTETMWAIYLVSGVMALCLICGVLAQFVKWDDTTRPVFSLLSDIANLFIDFPYYFLLCIMIFQMRAPDMPGGFIGLYEGVVLLYIFDIVAFIISKRSTSPLNPNK